MASLFRRTLSVAVMALAFLQVQTLSLQAEEITADNRKVEAASTALTEQAGEEGHAFYYAKRYKGRRTSSGTRYNPDKLTAAHPNFPLGSKVRVTNLANACEVVVTITDRCKKKKVPVIDLSRAAAKKLGFLGKGSARVKMLPLVEEQG